MVAAILVASSTQRATLGSREPPGSVEKTQTCAVLGANIDERR